MRPSRETKARSPVEAYDAIRAPGTAARMRPATAAMPRSTDGAAALAPAGSETTATSGALSPPLPNMRAMAVLVSYPSRPGTEYSWLKALVARPTVAIPISVTTSQKAATARRWRRTKRVSAVMAPLSSARSNA